jgi:hypothetical protein
MALRNAAYILAERVNLDVTEYIKQLKHVRKRLDLVGTSFDLSHNLLTKDLQEKWAMISIFSADFGQDAAAAIWNIDSALATDSLSNLLKLNLASYKPQVEPIL